MINQLMEAVAVAGGGPGNFRGRGRLPVRTYEAIICPLDGAARNVE
jgi:hypothetical protein